ncbi:hypothetical protein IEO21_06078 [Rhodonia placenta]|uniref:Uncharacterized protein n=1 Tax=Rhodonia placenta TaxID=104341 RepID=A0A8H7P153_9APHY|nr:hypothetical protein IEO21_06078 [Postia placenta]
MRIPPEKLQKPFIVSSVMFGGTLLGLLIWAVSNVHSAGPLFKEPGNPENGSIGWAMMFGITAILGSWGGGTLGQSDWTRYANRPWIIVTSCAQQITGQLIWEPFQLLSLLQDF